MSQHNDVHKAVQEHYGSLARTLNVIQPTACCNTTSDQANATSCCSPLYDAALLEGLPAEVTGLSLGCGDPVTIAALRPGETVLDLGSGGGIDCFLAARQVGEQGYVIGVDMTPDMLAKANASKARLKANNVEFRQGQIEALPVDDNTIDVVISNCVINLSPDKTAVFRDVYRVLKPGGRISISDIVTEGEFDPESRADLASWSECVTGAIDANDYTHMLRDAGFEDIMIVDKVAAEELIAVQPSTPRIFSARITASKPV